MKKALIVAHMPNFIPNFEQSDIEILQGMGYEVTAAFNTTGYEQYRAKMRVSDVEICHIGFERSPYSPKNITAYCTLNHLIDNGKFDLIHCHTPVGGAITRLAAREARKRGTKVIYTAHGFHFFKGAPLLNWLIYYPCELFCSYFTDVLITINKEDFRLANEKMKAKRISLIPGVGIDTKKFSTQRNNRQAVRQALGIQPEDVVLLSVGELTKGKNHRTVLAAIKSLENRKIHYLIAGCGELEEQLGQMIEEKRIANVHLLGYCSDVHNLYQAADIFVFPSFREGLSVALLEAIASGLPAVASDIRGNNECVQPGENGMLCNPRDVAAFAAAIKTLADSEELRCRLGAASAQRVRTFSIEQVQEKMQDIYTTIGQ